VGTVFAGGGRWGRNRWEYGTRRTATQRPNAAAERRARVRETNIILFRGNHEKGDAGSRLKRRGEELGFRDACREF
jgi:hypothetical protein